MTTTNIDTVQDLFRILDENPEWLEALRAKILTKELLELPENHAALTANVTTLTGDVVSLTARVDTLAAEVATLTSNVIALTDRVDALAARMDELTARVDTLTVRMDELTARVDTLTVRMDELTARVDALAARMDELTARVDALTARVDALTVRVDALTAELAAFTTEMRAFAEEMRAFAKAANRRLDNLDARFDRMERDNSDIKGDSAERKAAREIANIVEDLGKIWVRNLDREEIYALERAANIQGIPRGHLRSYRGADIIAEAVEPDDDAPCYVVVEASHTANGRETTRAIRSAGLLSRFSGKPAYPIIAGVRVDNETREAIDAGEIQYYELEANR